MAGNQGQQAIVRVFDVLGHERWTHGMPGITPGSSSAFSDVVCTPSTNRLYACGTLDLGLPTQNGVIATYQLDGVMVQGLRVDSNYGAGHPSSLECFVLQSDGVPTAFGRIQWYSSNWNTLWLKVFPSGDAGSGLLPWNASSESVFPGVRVLAGPLNELWVLSPWGQLGDARPTHWILEELDRYHYSATRFEAFPTSPSGDVGSFVGLAGVSEGVAVWGTLGPQADGTTDGRTLVVDTSSRPLGYCSVEPTPLGCEPLLSYTGRLWDTQRPMHLFATGLTNQSSALCLYSTTGPNSTPFLGGTLCVAPPLRRSAVKPTGGSTLVGVDCTGTFSVQLEVLLAPDPFAHVPGNQIFLQVWSRDAGDGKGRGTPAMRITVP